MTPPATTDLLAGSTFASTVAKLSAQHQLACTVRLLPRGKPHAETRAITRRISVEPSLLEEPDEAQAFSAAHEFGHLISARDRGLIRFLPMAAIGWGLAAALSVSVGPIALTNLAKPYLPTSIPVRLAVGLTALLIGIAVMLFRGHQALLRRAAHTRPLELEADMFALQQGYPLTPTVAAMIERDEASTRSRSTRPRSTRWQRYRTHPLPAERINSRSP